MRAPLGQVCAGGCELLDPVVAQIGDVDVAGRVHRDPAWMVELAIAGAGATGSADVSGGAVADLASVVLVDALAPHDDERARTVELLDPLVDGVRDVDVARGVGRDSLRPRDLLRARS